MLFWIRAALALVVSCALTTAAWAGGPAGDAVAAGLSWQLAFGGQKVEAGYGLSLGYRSNGEPLSKVLSFQVDGAMARATVAGVPLGARSYQSDETGAATDGPASVSPWYTHSWMLWTAGGIAATAALASRAGSGTSSESHTCSGTCNQTNSGNVASTSNNGSFCVQGQTCTPPGTCAPGVSVCVGCSGVGVSGSCKGGSLVSRPLTGEWSRLESEWLDEGTGGMGDLIAR